ncbi:MAG: helix-turn-helix domain-containing protein [Patescibacteria group bacterium]|nr:helix-turn-helix domain-containing protein [Patescibacteria group bacterium]
MTKKTKVKISFGNKLRQIRKEKGVSQEELGFRAGLHRTYIGSIERGEQSVSVDNVYKLAKALRVKPKDLFEF